jgi:hypothetical protein
MYLLLYTRTSSDPPATTVIAPAWTPGSPVRLCTFPFRGAPDCASCIGHGEDDREDSDIRLRLPAVGGCYE